LFSVRSPVFSEPAFPVAAVILVTPFLRVSLKERLARSVIRVSPTENCFARPVDASSSTLRS